MSKPSATPPHLPDLLLGRLIRLRRQELGLSQEQLGAVIGVTFQQVQKYEHGTNRVGFSRLVAIAGALHCRVADLVAPLDDKNMLATASPQLNELTQAGAADLLKAYCAIGSAQRRRALLRLAEALAMGKVPGTEPDPI